MTTVTRIWPPAPGGGGTPYTGVKWVTESEIDFAENFAAHGAKDFLVPTATSHTETLVDAAGNSVDWTAYADGTTDLDVAADTFAINASGLQIETSWGSGDWWNNTVTAPRVGPLIADVMAAQPGAPAYDYSNDTICIQAYITADVDPMTMDYRSFGLLLDRHTATQLNWLRVVMIHAGSTMASIAQVGGGQKEIHPLTKNATLFEIIVGPRLAAPLGRMSDWSGSFPEPGAPLNVSGWAGIEAAACIKVHVGPDDLPELDPTSTNGRLEFGAASSSAATAFTATLHKVRYLRLR